MMTVQVRFYTDPACPWSWAAEPAIRRLMWEFEGELEFVWVMGGLTRSYERANLLDVVSQWLVDAAEGGMPCDPRIWTENPLELDLPRLPGGQGGSRAGPAGRLPVSPHAARGDHVRAAQARSRRGPDRRGRAVRDRPSPLRDGPPLACDHRGVRGRPRGGPQPARGGPGGGRHPSQQQGQGEDQLPVGGVRRGGRQPPRRLGAAIPSTWRRCARRRGPPGRRPVNEGALEPLDAIKRFGRCATRELEVLAGRPRPVVEAELWALARDWKLKPVSGSDGDDLGAGLGS